LRRPPPSHSPGPSAGSPDTPTAQAHAQARTGPQTGAKAAAAQGHCGPDTFPQRAHRHAGQRAQQARAGRTGCATGTARTTGTARAASHPAAVQQRGLPEQPRPPIRRSAAAWANRARWCCASIDEQGQPQQLEINKSSGFERLDKAAEAVKRWKFVPGKRNGVPEGMWNIVPINFVLE
jgi:protein TonB